MKLPLILCLLASPVASGAEDFGNPVVWMDAASGIEAEGGAVKSWQSRTGSYVAVPPEDTPAPKLLPNGVGGKPAVQFGDNAYLSGPLQDALGAEVTFIAVVDIASGEQAGNTGLMMLSYTYGLSVDQGARVYRMMSYWPANVEKYGEEKAAAARGGGLVTEKDIGFDAPGIVTAVCGEEKSTIYVNGALVAEADIGLFREQRANSKDLGLGAYGGKGSKPMTGNIAEALLYDEALTPEKRSAIEKSLAAKYGVQLSQ